jgi:formate dehydrogenase major subunit
MKLTKTSDQVTQNKSKHSATSAGGGLAMSRRGFLRNSGLMAGGAALATTLTPTMMKKAQASASAEAGGSTNEIKTICTHCSVGCGILAEVQNGVWTGQEPAFDHPFRQVDQDILGSGY